MVILFLELDSRFLKKNSSFFLYKPVYLIGIWHFANEDIYSVECHQRKESEHSFRNFCIRS